MNIPADKLEQARAVADQLSSFFERPDNADLRELVARIELHQKQVEELSQQVMRLMAQREGDGLKLCTDLACLAVGPAAGLLKEQAEDPDLKEKLEGELAKFVDGEKRED